MHRRYLAGVALAVCCGVALAANSLARDSAVSHPRLEARGGERRDAWGRVIRRADGERINYPFDPTLKRTERQAARRDPGLLPPVPAGRSRAASASWPFEVREEWRWNVFGHDIGWRGLEVADIDADGTLEIVARAVTQTDYWHVLRADGAGEYVQIWVSDDYADWIGSLRVSQLDADPALEIVVGVGADLLVYDGATHELQRSIATSAWEIVGLELVDVDGDGAIEAVFSDSPYGVSNTLYIYDIISGSQEYAGAGQGGYDVAVGNVDGDPDLEIVVGNDTEPGFVLNGRTRQIEWTNPAGFGYFVELGDLDDDGHAEIVAGYSWSGISVFNAVLRQQTGTIPVSLNLTALRVGDVDADGSLEIVYGDGQWGSLYAHDRTLAREWEIENPDHGVLNLAFCDCDQDGWRDVIWGADEHLYAARLPDRAIQWESPSLGGPFYALSHGDVDDDDRPELLYGSHTSDAGYGDGLWFVRDAETKTVEFQSAPTNFNWNGLWRIRQADIDDDPQQEIFVASDRQYVPMILCYDGLTHAEQWRASLPQSDYVFDAVTALDIGDVDGDGTPELVAGYGEHVFLLDPASGAVLWQSPAMPPTGYRRLSLLRLADLDGDRPLEIVIAGELGSVHVIDWSEGTTRDLGRQDATALDTADLDQDGNAEIVVGTSAGDLRVLSPTGGTATTLAHFAKSIDALRVVDLSGDGVPDYVLSVDNEVVVRSGTDGATLWSSGRLNQVWWGTVGASDSLRVADIDDDRRQEIVVSAGSLGLRIYEVLTNNLSLSATDGPDPSLVGDNISFTFTVTNVGSHEQVDAHLAVAVPPDATLVSAPMPQCIYGAPVVDCRLDALAPGASHTITVVLSTSVAGELTVSGEVSADSDVNPSDNTASTTTTVTATVTADLGLVKASEQALAVPGRQIAYELTVSNAGPWPVSSVQLTDNLPAMLLEPAFTPLSGSYDPSSGTWTGLSLAAGQSAVLTLRATVAPHAHGLLTNSASVATPVGTGDPQLANNTAAHSNVVGVELGELAHGTSLNAKPMTSGEVYFRILQEPRSSYEVVLDQVSGDLGSRSAPILLQRLGPDAASVLAEADAVGLGVSRSLRWQNVADSTIGDRFIRVRSAGCSDDCGPHAGFRLRAYETTVRLPRFNNAGGQATVLILQNGSASAVAGNIWFWRTSGQLVALHAFSGLSPHSQLVLATNNLPGAAGQSGAITITHDAPYGSLSGKASSLEPANGFAFDTALVIRPE